MLTFHNFEKRNAKRKKTTPLTFHRNSSQTYYYLNYLVKNKQLFQEIIFTIINNAYGKKTFLYRKCLRKYLNKFKNNKTNS